MDQRLKFSRILVIIICLLIFSVSASSCGLEEWVAPYLQPPTPISGDDISKDDTWTNAQEPDPTLPLPALVTFKVTIPENTPVGSMVNLTLLDDVTGLALNAQQLPMELLESPNLPGQVYSVTVPLVMGSLVKYRYERSMDQSIVAEHTSDGSPVRYRLYHVEGPGVVEDVVHQWTDTTFTGPSGRISGRAIDDVTGNPIPNLLISVGGAQTWTASDGSFLIEGLAPGIHNLVAFAIDGTYRVFQQGAQVAAYSTTPAELRLFSSVPVNVVFTVHMPEGTPPLVPIRMAGNLYPLGNTFGSLSGGMSTLAGRMPVLTAQPDGSYALTLILPEGADIRYKYTLGDGFWNSERTAEGGFRLRQLIISPEKPLVEDTVESWASGEQGSLTFDVTTPPGTPVTDTLSIQFNPLFGWTEPIPMWRLGENRWAYILYSPLEFPELGYRYCRNGQCGSADDSLTAGGQNPGRKAALHSEPQLFTDLIESWAWLNTPPLQALTPTQAIRSHGPDFITGIEWLPAYHPSWNTYLSEALNDTAGLGARWLVLDPTWTATRNNPPVLEPVAGADALWPDWVEIIQQSEMQGLNVALSPSPRFLQPSDEWWNGASRDYSWWLVWFASYRAFILHYADLANQTGTKALILGGEWVNPALPSGVLADGTPSGVPADAGERWRALLGEIRQRYSGQLLWALPSGQSLPPFIDMVDQIYLLWPGVHPLGGDLETQASNYLDTTIWPMQMVANKPLIIAVAYPSAAGGLSGCVADGQGGCVPIQSLSPLHPEIPAVQNNLQEQVEAYTLMLNLVNQRDWISGIVSRGFYPPVTLQDNSTSVHGKPAADLLHFWYPGLTGQPGAQ